MADIKQKLGTNGQAFTITIASLTNNSARQSTVVDNTTDLFMQVLCLIKIKTAAASTSSTGYVNVYAFGTVDNGTTYPEGLGASDAAATLVSPTNLVLVYSLNCVANSTTYISDPFGIAKAFDGWIPAKWGIVIENKTGATLDATGGNHAAMYQGLYGQTV